jgi:hypothetical protein
MKTAFSRMRRSALAIVAVFAVTACSGSGDAEKASEAPAPTIAETPEAYRAEATRLRREGKFKEASEAALKAYTLAGSGPRVAERLELAKAQAAASKAGTEQEKGRAISGAINEIKSLETEKRTQGVPVDEVHIAEVYALLGDANSVFRWLTRAVEARSPNVATVETNPDFESMKADPRWAQFLATAK